MAFYSNEAEYTEFLIKNNLSPNQYDFCWKLYNHKIKNTHLDKIYKCFNEIRKADGKTSKYISQEEINDLIRMEFVKEELNTKSKFPDIYEVTNKFYKNLFIQTTIGFDELVANYPRTITVNGTDYNALNIDFEEAKLLYRKKVENSIIKHSKIIEELKNQVKLDKINCGLDKWLRSEGWRLDTINTVVKDNSFV